MRATLGSQAPTQRRLCLSGPSPAHQSCAAVPLADLPVIVIDCQATAACPRGQLLELGWARVSSTTLDVQARLISLPDGERIPSAVTRITGITDRALQNAVDAAAAWRNLLSDAAAFAQQPAPAVIHFARFERAFLRQLAGGAPPLDVVCTHEIARRLFPDLPRRSLRALAGYFGRGVSPLRRSADHVEATAFVWRALVELLEREGVSTWSGLHDWLADPGDCRKPSRRVSPMPRDLRLSLPDAPGVYRLLRSSGDVLYVGKASSLRDRVNSHFRKQRGLPDRTLEMLSQVRGVSFEVTATALEAALLESDEIKRQRPPYNVALGDQEYRHVWFAAPDLSERSPRPSQRCVVGPLVSIETLDQFTALARANRSALGTGRWAPDAATFDVGYARLVESHDEFARDDLSAYSRLLRLGTRLWREGRRDGDDPEATGAERAGRPMWTPEQVQIALEWLALRAALACRRARWLTRLVDAAIVWSEPGVEGARLILIENGEIQTRTGVESGAPPPIPPGYRRPVSERHDDFTVARFDRLRVLTTELKRLVSQGAPAAVRFGASPALTGSRLANALSWV